VARPRYPRSSGPLPPPLPAAERTIGQLVAETIRLYGRNFWRALALGVPLAVADQLTLGATIPVAIVLLVVFAPAFALTYAAAVRLASGRPYPPRRWAWAVAVGTAVFVPAAFVLPWFALLGFAWFALVGLAVPVVLVEDAGPRTALVRAVRLAWADYAHALGALATLAITFFLTRLSLFFLLREQSDQTERVAVFLADVVLSPLLYLGAALLYDDQAARLIRSSSPKRSRRRRRDAHLHPADEADRAGGADAEVESGPAPGGQR
jgi:hypothetical protein